jgi:hypothetical protein
MYGRETPRQPILNLPERTPAQVHVMLHQPHPAVLRPALLVVVADDVLVVGVGVFGEVALDELTGFVLGEFEDDIQSVDVAHVDADRVLGLELEGFV